MKTRSGVSTVLMWADQAMKQLHSRLSDENLEYNQVQLMIKNYNNDKFNWKSEIVRAKYGLGYLAFKIFPCVSD